jgi:hypothetical protein
MAGRDGPVVPGATSRLRRPNPEFPIHGTAIRGPMRPVTARIVVETACANHGSRVRGNSEDAGALCLG